MEFNNIIEVLKGVVCVDYFEGNCIFGNIRRKLILKLKMGVHVDHFQWDCEFEREKTNIIKIIET